MTTRNAGRVIRLSIHAFIRAVEVVESRQRCFVDRITFAGCYGLFNFVSRTIFDGIVEQENDPPKSSCSE